MQTRVGNITFDYPQVREGVFYPGALEKDLRSERALILALAGRDVRTGYSPKSDAHSELRAA